MNKSPYNLAETLNVAKINFAGKNPLTMAANSGCLLDLGNNRFTVRLLGQIYLVDYPSGLVTCKIKGSEAALVVSILLLHYLTQATGVEPDGNWISFKELQGGSIYSEPFEKRAITPFVKSFGNLHDDFAEAALKLGGEQTEFGDISFIMPVLPRVSIIYILWSGDDEFPPSGNILFDKYANAYLPTEDLAMLSGVTVGALVKSINN